MTKQFAKQVQTAPTENQNDNKLIRLYAQDILTIAYKSTESPGQLGEQVKSMFYLD